MERVLQFEEDCVLKACASSRGRLLVEERVKAVGEKPRFAGRVLWAEENHM